ncbi:MAG: ATP-dependent RecD-like DNA helicase [Alphaproteobacteria bacterium]|nr:ATP-dependent RecD-like DNA helicase [Alphaproteobacteria bacterium]
MPWLEGTLERVLWSSDSSGWAVVRLHTVDQGSVMAVGSLASLDAQEEGAFVALEGDFEDHAVHGRQFRATGLLEATPHTEQGLRVWLASAGVKGIGPAIAGRLVDHFGFDLVRVMQQEPRRLREVEGMGPSRISALTEAWSRDEEGRALTLLLRGLGLSQRLADRIRQRYGERATHVVRHEPFRLADEIGGVGFKTADALARQQGLPRDDPGRVRAALRYVVEQEAENNGHCFTTRAELARRLEALDVPTDRLDDALDAAEGAGRVVLEGDEVWPAELHQSEDLVARELAALAPGPDLDPGEEIARAERWVGVTLDPSQREAVRLALRGGVCVVTGGPGTGKTTLLRVLLRVLVERGAKVALASPTGRAARRMEEATGMPASTLHRLLKYDPGRGGFQLGVTEPLEVDVVVVDETSMVDLPLLRALVDALPIGGPVTPSLVLVGDADQLPSVGPGQVLRDLIASEVLGVARLDTVHRQAGDSGILEAARDVRQGRVPAPRSEVRDVFLLARPEAEDALRTLLTVVAERLPANGFDARADVQVLAPTRRGALGTERLNQELQARLNPDSPGLKRGETEFRLHDRVICTKNRYDVEVFNGDVGRVTRVELERLTIDFDGRTVVWERDDLTMLDLAWATTVHKSQGSEYPAVVLALHGSHGLLLRRNLFYTAITRAKRFVCVVGAPDAWGRAVRQVGGDERRTGLGRRLRTAALRAEEG